MPTAGKFIRLCAASSLLALAACAPSFGGEGLQLGISPTGQVSAGMSSCSLVGTSSAPYARAAKRSPFNALQKVSQIQARYSATYRYDVGAQQAAWKKLASGDC